MTDSKKDDNGNFEQLDCCSVKEVLDVDEASCETCLVEETIVEHGCDDDVIIVQNDLKLLAKLTSYDISE